MYENREQKGTFTCIGEHNVRRLVHKDRLLRANINSNAEIHYKVLIKLE